MPNKRVLIYAPYGAFKVHHQADAVIGAALRLRGCEVSVLLCNRIFADCVIAGNPPDQSACFQCSQSGSQMFGMFGLPTVPMGSLVAKHEAQQIKEWSEFLPVCELEEATFNGNPLGEWVCTQMYSHFKTSELDFDDGRIVRAYRSLLYNAGLIQVGYLKYIDSFRPDYVLCYNGVHAYYRIVFELSRQRNIPVLVHERGYIEDSFLFVENNSVLAYENRFDFWNRWKDVPLSAEEFSTALNFIVERETGRNTSFFPIYDFSSDERMLRTSLRIPADGRIISLFTTGDWESGMSKGHHRIVFPSQIEWMHQTAQICAERGDFLVIRHHPLGAGIGSYPPAKTFLQKLCNISHEFGPHVRVIMPAEKVTSYALLWNSDAALIMSSTVGAEALLRGIATVALAESQYLPMGIELLKDQCEYRGAIENAVQKTQSFGIPDLARAYRYFYYWFFRLAFKFRSFGIRNIYEPDIRIKTLDDLKEGRDPDLDRICNHIIYETPLFEMPDESRMAYEGIERELLSKELEKIRRNRSAIRQAAAGVAAFREPLVSIVRMREDGLRYTTDNILARSLVRSRHKNLERLEMPASPYHSSKMLLEAMEDAAARATGDLIHITSDKLHVDESIYSSSSDFLRAPENARFDGICWAAWKVSPDGSFKDEIFTERRPVSTLEQLIDEFAFVKNPLQLLSFIVLRKSAFRRIVKGLQGQDDLRAALFKMLLSDGAPFAIHHTRRALLAVHMPEDPAKLACEAHKLLESGKPAEALTRIEEARLLGAPHWDNALEALRIQAKIYDGRTIEARCAAEAAVRRTPSDPVFWDLLRKIILLLLPSGFTYDDIAPAVERIDGYLVPGQERFLFDKVMSLPNDAAILEVGSYLGRSTAAMAFACAGTQRHIYCIDTFFGNEGPMGKTEDFLDTWQANLRQYDLERYVTALPGYSYEVLPNWNGKPKVDFAFLDGSHEYRDVLRDLEMTYPLVKTEGWIALHDVEPGWPGPWRVWRQSAMPVLTSHQYSSSLACGRKTHEARQLPFADAPFSYAREWAIFLKEKYPEASQIAQALLETIEGGSRLDRSLDTAHKIITHIMPDNFRVTIRHMLSKEASKDPHLHYWNGLILAGEGKHEEARQAFEEAFRLSDEPLKARLSAYLRLAAAHRPSRTDF